MIGWYVSLGCLDTGMSDLIIHKWFIVTYLPTE